MKPSFSCAVVLCLYPTFTAPVLAQDFLDKIRPVVEFEHIPLPNGSIQHSIAIETKPGLLYTFQSSDNLVSWNDDAVYYSLGQKLTHALRESTPPPAPDPEAPPASAYPSAFATLLVQPSNGTSGGTVVSWRSLDDGRAVTYHIAGNMDPAWQLVPMIVCDYDSHQFFFSHPPGNVAPPTENPTLGEKDAIMIAVLEDRLDEINQSLINSAYHTQQLPAPAPTAGQRRFLRVKATAVDTDGDNVTDLDEFLLAAENNPLGNAFNPDADGNGAPDDTQVDTDDDGQVNANDATPSDGTAAYATVPYVRYAFFEIPGEAGQINNQGIVLYSNKTWQGGVLVDLQGINKNDVREHANGINDSGLIIGQAVITRPDGGTDTAACAWFNRRAGRSIYATLSEGGLTFPTSYNDEGVYFSNSFLGPDGRFAGLRKDYESGPVTSSHHIWKLVGDPPVLSSAPAPAAAGMQHMIGAFGTNGIMWGQKAKMTEEEPTKGIVFAPQELPELPFVPRNVIRHDLPNGQTAIFALPDSGTARVYLNGSWKDSPAYANAMGIAGDGTAIGMNIPAVGVSGSPGFQAAKVAPIFLNGKWTSIEQAAPGLPADWENESAQLVNVSPGGWILANQTNPTTNDQKAAVMLPIRVTGVPPDLTVPEVTGVDDFSIGANPPDPTILNRFWIMAPFGSDSETQISLKAPLNASTPLRPLAEGVQFGAGSNFTLTSPVTAFNVVGTNANVVSPDVPVRLTMGTSESASTPIGVKVMKARVINVVLWRIGSDRNSQNVSPGDPAYENPVYPSFNPTPFQLQSHLNKIFFPQINTLFHCEVRSASVKFDKMDGLAYGAPANKSQPRNGYLDTTVDLGNEFDFIRDSCSEPNAHINVYVVGGAVFLRVGFWDAGRDSILSKFNDGMTDPNNRRCVVAGAGGRLDSEILDVISHEIGHVVIMEGHPDQGDGAAPLPGTTHVKRLMCSGGLRKKDGSSTRIVKDEWDAAEVWLRRIVDGNNP